MADITITRNDDAGRYEICSDGTVAGVCEFALADCVVTFPHTEVYPEYAGQGLAGKLVGFALRDVLDGGLGERRVNPTCSYVAAFIDKHPEFSGLLA